MFYCFMGVFIGTLIGVLPGIGPVGAMSILLPITYKTDPVASIIMLSGIYYGAQYGGTITSILVNIPGEASTVVTCLDGYAMTQQGRAGPALGIAAFGSFIAGNIAAVGLMVAAPLLASVALQFGPSEYFSLICMGLTLLIYLASGSAVRAIMMTVFGIILGCIGQDPQSGTPRFVFGLPEFLDGIGLAPFVMGLFGISEVFFNIEEIAKERLFFETKIKGLLPSWQDWKDSIRAILRGSVLGFMLGVLPGGGALIASFASYAIEKKVSKHPEKFGKGAIEGVAGPESANNAAAEGAFVPMFTLGIPPNVVMALLLGALMIHGITPGPFLIPNHPEIFWGVVASMYVGNLFLLVLNVPLIGVWVQLLKVPYVILFPLILLFCLIGAYSINNSTLDITVMLIFGGFGYLMRKFEFEAAPMVLGFVLGPMLENNLRLSLILSGGSFSIFFSRPIAAGGMIISFFLVISCFVPIFGKKRRKIPIEEA
jgi:putative tricarboxylic transport membrane protein